VQVTEVFDEAIVRTVCEQAGFSPAEREVAVLVCRGVPAKAIARQLHKTLVTIHDQRRSAYDKLDVSCLEEFLYVLHNRAAALWAEGKRT
jgi:DNA-binding NarL/FixJ family response regulator